MFALLAADQWLLGQPGPSDVQQIARNPVGTSRPRPERGGSTRRQDLDAGVHAVVVTDEMAHDVIWTGTVGRGEREKTTPIEGGWDVGIGRWPR